MFSYIWMKVLEKRPGKYQRGFSFLTRGRIDKIKKELVFGLVEKDYKILELGCGPGTFLVLAAEKGAHVIGIDKSLEMLEVAKDNLEQRGLIAELLHMDLLDLSGKFDESSFDRVFSFLTFSELERGEIDLVLKACRGILKSGGKLVLLDEVLPERIWIRFIYAVLRFPLVFLTYLFAGSITHPLDNPEEMVRKAGFESVRLRRYPWTNLALAEANKR